jgi:hypothetical protein
MGRVAEDLPPDLAHSTGAPPPGRSLVALGPAEPPIPRREMDYALLAVLVRVQHLRRDEALVLLDGLIALGMKGPEVLLARAVVELGLERFEDLLETIRTLDRLDPPEASGGRRISEKVRVRSYMKARAIFALTGKLDAEGKASLDFYLRQGRPKPAPG